MTLGRVAWSLARGLGCLVGGLGLCVLSAVAWRWSMFQPVRDVEAQLRAIPGVRDVRMGASDELTYIKDIQATVELEGGGRLRFSGLEPEHFVPGGSRSLSVRRVGPFTFSTCGGLRGLQGEVMAGGSFGGSVDLLAPSGLARELPFAVRHVQDLIANYDALLATVARQQRYPHFRESRCLRWTSDGGVEACGRSYRPPLSLASELVAAGAPSLDGMPLEGPEQLLSDHAFERLSVHEGEGRGLLRCDDPGTIAH